MAVNALITAINYDASGQTVQNEYVEIQNLEATPIDLSGWTLRAVAPAGAPTYTFGQFSLPPGGQVRVWTTVGTNTATDLYWNLGASIWYAVGDTVLLRDAGRMEVSRFRLVVLPVGTTSTRIAVPAYWSLVQRYDQAWTDVKRASSVVDIVVIEASWPQTAKGDAVWKGLAQAHLNTLPGAVLGYVHADRDPQTGDLLQNDILEGANKQDSVKAWYDQFSQQIDGIYFDDLVLPDFPNAPSQAEIFLTEFKRRYPNARAMILAGQCIDEKVVGPNVDWTILWENEAPVYRTNFYGAKLENGDPYRPQFIPAWWKNPAYRQKIVHIVHNCDAPDKQHVLGLANERNAGHVFVMDRRDLKPGANPNDPKSYRLYDHMPPYWDSEVSEADSYYDFGFDPQRALRGAYRYGVSQGKVHAWPNFEGAWYPTGHVRGTFLLDAGAHVTERDVLQTDLPGAPPLYDIPAVWSAAHQYAQSQGFETALPTFEEVQTPNGLSYRLIL